MTKPSICWIGGEHADAIWSMVREEISNIGYRRVTNPNDAQIVCFSAGDPFWFHPGHYKEQVDDILNNPKLKVVIIERHEFGWSNYFNQQQRWQNAWLGIPDYGRDTDVSGGRHGDLHKALHHLCLSIEPERLLYFRREYFRDFPYPSFVHPINFHVNTVTPKLSKDQFVNRPYDVGCVWAVTHEHRRVIGDRLKLSWPKSFVRSPATRGTPDRIPEGEPYRRAFEDCRLFVTSDGHGLGGGREWDLITTSAMLRKRSWMVLPHEFINGESCLEWGSPNEPDPDGLIALLNQRASDVDGLYNIYSNGHDHAASYHTGPARGRYVEERMRARGFV